MDSIKDNKHAWSSKTFFNDIERHMELVANPENKDYHDSLQTFAVGKKLFLEVEVVDSQMSYWLYKWLYSTNVTTKEPKSVFGCELKTIHFEQPGKDDLKRKLIEMIEQL